MTQNIGDGQPVKLARFENFRQIGPELNVSILRSAIFGVSP
jgi:hypothetical protein